MDTRKKAICDALRRFIDQRPGLEFANYGDVASYRSESRSITRDGHQARELLRAVEWRDGITADDIIKAAQSAYSGRLTITIHDAFKDSTRPLVSIDYCTGQYFPTEYRRAACAVLASALWDHVREHCMPAPVGYRAQSWMQPSGTRARDVLRATREEAQADVDRHGGSQWGSVDAMYGDRDSTAGDWLRAHFKREFGRTMAARWLS